jgi:hypothetical protein
VQRRACKAPIIECITRPSHLAIKEDKELMHNAA